MKTKEERGWVKDGEKKEKEKEAQVCRNPGLNQGPLDLQSNALPTELFRPDFDAYQRDFQPGHIGLTMLHNLKKLIHMGN